MESSELIALLNRLREEPHETEWLEFKAKSCAPQTLGEYLSALSNSASVHGKTTGYLVFGVEDETHRVVGTSFDPDREKKSNQPLLLWLTNGLNPRMGIERHVFDFEGRRVVLFEIRAARGQPVKFYGKACIRVGSSKTELARHPDKERRIWERQIDWSAQICERASLNDLDPAAIRKARTEFATKFPAQKPDMDVWNDATFLNKARVTIQHGITNAALLLLGRPESASLLSPAVAWITWVLKDEKNAQKDYEHFGLPFLLTVDHLLAKIRNLTVRAMPSGTLFPVEMPQYDPWVIREALHNCIAHQDYGLRGKINVVEWPDRLLLTNVGSFMPGSVEQVIRQDAPPEIYRNPFLAQAMVSLNMIDTQGGGIKRMFQTQARRYFPMPDYDLREKEKVVVAIRNSVLDERYTRMLMERTDLDLSTIILLDKVQKRMEISREQCRILKAKGLIEGRYPNVFMAGRIASVAGQQAKHILNRGLDKRYYVELIMAMLREHQPVGRDKVDDLLLDKLPEVLSREQKRTKIRNLLAEMAGPLALIENVGGRRWPRWQLRSNSFAKSADDKEAPNKA